VWDGLSWTPGTVAAQDSAGALKALLLSFSKFGDAFFTDATDAYTAVQQILWPGSPAIGNPAGIRAILFADSGASYSLRIVNVASGASVAEASGSATVATATSLTLNSFPTGSALLEIQLKKTGGAGRFVSCAAMEFSFS
jgi:ribosomal protein L2